MIYGIGADIFEISRIKEEMEKDEDFVKYIFTEEEISYCKNMRHKEQHYAVRFSAKEAFMKALGTGWRFGIKFSDICVLNDELGKPHIRLSGKTEELVKREGISGIYVTLSHTSTTATAYVVLEKFAVENTK